MVRVRQTTAVDGDRLREIQAAALPEPWPELLDAALGGFPPLFVATETRPVGYGIVMPGPEETAYLTELAVAPDEQRKGYGSALLRHIAETQRSDGYERLALTVRAVDEGAKEFYREHGFETVERLPDEYDSGAGFLLVRDLTEPIN
ncbi:GNAT family N-acetyltransferase [Halovenus sp. WSH3]|uniref:GNAT family N-acetyltransferase n=1 Tax=Halovenus carboxidivorans TaxID=2692199 RepID=A0A6B0T9V9_9EURY|nr:GNAT family N-acetyltransferase [Halovenus carboxidivorans]MXR52363.1 GNAT family N-acetyltransferase [Halovenus carboxidivorans]